MTNDKELKFVQNNEPFPELAIEVDNGIVKMSSVGTFYIEPGNINFVIESLTKIKKKLLG